MVHVLRVAIGSGDEVSAVVMFEDGSEAVERSVVVPIVAIRFYAPTSVICRGADSVI